MRVLMIHKFYYVEGGAERYFFNVKRLLEQHGHEVIPFAMEHPRNLQTRYSRYFPSLVEAGLNGRLRNPRRVAKDAFRFVYNREAQDKLAELIQDTNPEVAHVHGVYHHLSPAILSTLREHGLPVVFTLHEYKILCPAYVFLDGKGRVCEKCAGGARWHATVNRCFRSSYFGSMLVTVEAYVHDWLGSYRKNVDLFVSPSRFLRSKMVQYGWEARRIEWLPYTLPVWDYQPYFEPGDYFVYVGRLQREKGIQVLVEAMARVREGLLYVVGTGLLEPQLRERTRELGLTNVRFLGYKSGRELRRLVAHARFTVVPSVVYDNSPLAIYESFSLGKPVVGAEIGGIPELIDPGTDGFLCKPGEVSELADAINQAWACGDHLSEMGRNARRKAENLFSPDVHYGRLMDIYERVSDGNK